MGTSITSERVTDGQVAKVKELVEATLRKSGLQGDAVQRIIEKGGEFQSGLIPLFQRLGELPYADEEVESSYGYRWQLKSLAEQLAVLQGFERFKMLDASRVTELAEAFSGLPEGADGLVVIPKPSKVVDSYNEAVVLMTELMASQRKDWYNYREGRLGPKYLRLTEKTQQALSRLEQKTGDYLVIPVQTGLRHRGRSVRRARVMMSDNEFGLGPYEVGIILLTHPERLQKYEHLAIDCAGCEYCPDADGEFSVSLCFRWCVGRLEFYYHWVGTVTRHFGSASGFC